MYFCVFRSTTVDSCPAFESSDRFSSCELQSKHRHYYRQESIFHYRLSLFIAQFFRSVVATMKLRSLLPLILLIATASLVQGRPSSLRELEGGSCSKKGEKAVKCGADKKDGRAKKCCSGLVCGGEKGRYCVNKDDDDDDDDDICSPKGEKAEKCGAEPKKGRGKKCCSGLVCGGDKDRYCVKGDDDGDDDNDYDDDDDDDNDFNFDSKDPGFLWNLYYEPGIKWEFRGSDFCVMCRKYKCEKGDYVVTSHCNANEPHFRWEYVKVGSNSGLMKTKTKNLCLEGDGSWDFTLQPCSKSNKRQHFEGINLSGKKFQLRPKEHKGNCMTMLHHPLAKNDVDGEMIIDQVCWKAAKTETLFWVADYRKPIKEELKRSKKKCDKEKCGECEGYCEDDSECKGDLYCYQRGDKGWRTNLEMKYNPNPWAQIPGCSGYGKPGKNYCSEKKYKSPYSDKEIKEILDKN